MLVFDADSTYDCIQRLLACWRERQAVCLLNPRLPSQARQALLCRIGQIPTHIATLICTSGTTGVPKIAAHTLDNYIASATASAKALDLGPGDSWHLSLPLFHVSGLSILYRCLVSGAKLVISSDLLSVNATHYSLVPTQLYRILHDPLLLAHYRKARCLLIGGAPLSSALEDEAREAGLALHTSWGMTETTALAILDGKPLPHIEASLADDGEILVRGSSLFLGYLENGALSLPLAKGWFHTKDIGAFDAEGRLIWKGRKDLMFISGGENIHPEEIEHALYQLPGVLEAVVVGIADPEFGTRPAAFIRTAYPLDFETVKTGLSPYLLPFKVPKWIFPFPPYEGIKPNRDKLRQAAEKVLRRN